MTGTLQRTDEEVVRGLGLEEGFVDAGGTRLHYVAAGTGPLVLFLHGFPQYWYTWRHQLPDLAAHCRVVALDLRGYGRSDRPAGRRAYQMDHLVQDVAAVVEALGGGRATVVGHDWGGAIAWAYAHAHPAQLERLVICNAPHPLRLAAELRRPPQLFRSWYIFFFQLPWLPEALLTRDRAAAIGGIIRHGAASPDVFQRDEIRHYREAFAQPGVARAAIDYYRSLLGGLRRARAEVPPVEAPVLLLWGEQDKALDRRLLTGNDRFAPRLEIVRFPDAGHFLHEERPAAFNAQLRRFVLERSA